MSSANVQHLEPDLILEDHVSEWFFEREIETGLVFRCAASWHTGEQCDQRFLVAGQCWPAPTAHRCVFRKEAA